MTVSIEQCSRRQANIEASYVDMVGLFGQPCVISNDPKIHTLFEVKFLDLEIHLDYFINSPSWEAIERNPESIYTWTISSSDVLAPDRLQSFINFVNNAWTNDQKWSPAANLKVNIKSYYNMS